MSFSLPFFFQIKYSTYSIHTEKRNKIYWGHAIPFSLVYDSISLIIWYDSHEYESFSLNLNTINMTYFVGSYPILVECYYKWDGQGKRRSSCFLFISSFKQFFVCVFWIALYHFCENISSLFSLVKLEFLIQRKQITHSIANIRTLSLIYGIWVILYAILWNLNKWQFSFTGNFAWHFQVVYDIMARNAHVQYTFSQVPCEITEVDIVERERGAFEEEKLQKAAVDNVYIIYYHASTYDTLNMIKFLCFGECKQNLICMSFNMRI